MSRDWIEEYLIETESIPSPDSYKLWTGIHTIAAVLERRVWTITSSPRPLWPNLYTFLIGIPAAGKTMITDFAKALQKELVDGENGIMLGPDNPSSASFLDEIYKARKAARPGMETALYSSLSVVCVEFGSLMSKYDKPFADMLTHIYDNPVDYSSPRRQSTSVFVESPSINLLACSTPGALGEILPEGTWDQGFTSRLIMIYGAPLTGRVDFFRKQRGPDTVKLAKFLREVFHELDGEFEWDEDAARALNHWLNEEGRAPVPDYGRLQHYNSRRNAHVAKLAMISAVSAHNGLRVTLADLRRAQSWLFTAEKTMPDIFRAMKAKSDDQVLDDVQWELWQKYSTQLKALRRPLNSNDLWKVFKDRATSDRIPGLIVNLENSGRIRKTINSGEFIPNPPGEQEETDAPPTAVVTPFPRSGA